MELKEYSMKRKVPIIILALVIIIACLSFGKFILQDIPVDLSNETEYNNLPIFRSYQNDEDLCRFEINGIRYKAVGFGGHSDKQDIQIGYALSGTTSDDLQSVYRVRDDPKANFMIFVHNDSHQITAWYLYCNEKIELPPHIQEANQYELGGEGLGPINITDVIDEVSALL